MFTLKRTKKLKNGKNKRHNKSNKNNKMIPKYSKHLSEPWFSMISIGLKTVEGRLNKGRFKDMEVGDIIEWHNEDFKERKFLTKIIGKNEYKTFEEYLVSEGLSVYFKYFSKEKESEFGVVAIKIKVIL